jgi:Zn-dependent protease with chaperone function
VIGAILGVLVALGLIEGSGTGQGLFSIGAGQAVTVASVAAGFFVGLAGGFLVVVRFLVLNHPVAAAVSIASGAVIAVIITVVMAVCERLSLRLRGYRRLSRDEVRRIATIVKAVADDMDLDALPRFAMSDSMVPGAWTHMRTVVLSTGLLSSLTDDELGAILAHEFHHWRSGDSVASHIIWAASLPLALIYNVGMLLAGRTPDQKPGQKQSGGKGPITFGKLVGWAIAWPAAILIRLVLVAVTSSWQRQAEYEADAVAAAIGRGAALASALRKMGAFEAGRTGWEQAMAATHPRTELRVEALQPPKDDDEEYQESELRIATLQEAARIFRSIL